MTAEKRIREKYGLTQPDLANYLDISLILLKRVETGDRSLPIPALLKFSEIGLFDAQQEATERKNDTTDSQIDAPATTNKIPNRAVNKAALQLSVAQRHLQKVQTVYEQAQRLQALCNYLLEKKPTDKIEMLWLEAQQISAKRKLQRYSPAEQDYLEWKAACLQLAIEKGKEMMGEALP